MPKLSPTMEEGQISRWLKKEGDAIEANESIAEVDTDKATMEVTSLDAGTLLKIVIGDGANARLGETIGIIGEKGEDFSSLLGDSTNGSAAPKAEESAEVKEENKDLKYVRREHRFRNIKRSFTLDEKIDSEKIVAKYVNGVLTLNLPKRQEVKTSAKQISIQ